MYHFRVTTMCVCARARVYKHRSHSKYISQHIIPNCMCYSSFNCFFSFCFLFFSFFSCVDRNINTGQDTWQIPGTINTDRHTLVFYPYVSVGYSYWFSGQYSKYHLVQYGLVQYDIDITGVNRKTDELSNNCQRIDSNMYEKNSWALSDLKTRIQTSNLLFISM